VAAAAAVERGAAGAGAGLGGVWGTEVYALSSGTEQLSLKHVLLVEH